MTKPRLVRETTTPTIRVTPTLEERVAMVRAFVDAQRVRKDYKPGWFEEVETELHKRMVEIERDLTSEIIAAHDVDAPAIEIEGKLHRRVLRAAQTYMTAAGPVIAERWLYRERDDDSQPAVSPVERRLGIIDFWTPKAAKQALWVVAQMTPQKAAETFARIGSMTPSKSSLDRLPKKLSEVWEASREEHEAALRDAIVVPEGAVSVAVSLDGVLAPIEGGNRPGADFEEFKRATARKPSTVSQVGGQDDVSTRLERRDYFCALNETWAVGDVNGDGLSDAVAFKRGPWAPIARSAPWTGGLELRKAASSTPRRPSRSRFAVQC